MTRHSSQTFRQSQLRQLRSGVLLQSRQRGIIGWRDSLVEFANLDATFDIGDEFAFADEECSFVDWACRLDCL